MKKPFGSGRRCNGKMANQEASAITRHRNGRGRSRLRWFLGLLVVTAIAVGFTYSTMQQGKLNQALADAVVHDDVKGAYRLLDKGADPNTHLVYENRPRTPAQVIKWLVRSREIFWHNEPVLVVATENGDVQLVETLLDRGADINATDQNGWTALMNAASAGRTDVVPILLNRGANVNIHGGGEKTALEIAVEDGHPDVVQMLRRVGETE
jgi:hypothetical protein